MSSSSHGQRFRRRAVRRGYKVDEVDAFLDRVEATLNGIPSVPVAAQDVHDVVFRVRFGGYDEWQVDLHLDRVERQIAELEERVAPPGVGAQLRAAMNGPMGAPPPLPIRTPNAHVPTSSLPRFDQQPYDNGRDPSYATTGGYSSLADGMREAPSYGFPGDLPQRPRPDEIRRPDITGEIRRPDITGEIRRPDITGEIRRVDPYGAPPPAGYGAPVSSVPFRPPLDRPGGGYDTGSYNSVSNTGSFHSVSNTGSFSSIPASAYGPPPGGAESQRVDQLRRTFQLRRFGSGYDPGQVDRLFENVLGALSGRGGVNESELDPSRLNLVPGGYYEAEVDQAIREVREILRTR
jgi:DivIVA domain-containing protein